MTHDSNISIRTRIQRAQAGDEQAMDELVRENLALVKFVVRRYINRGKEYDDLYQLGCLGLVKAIKNFDLSYDVKFSTYAVPVILGEVRRYLRDDGLMRVSRSIKENMQRIYQYIDEYESQTGNEPSIEQISVKLELSMEDALLALNASRPTRSLSEPIGEDGSMTLGDTVGIDPTEEIDQRIELKRLIEHLPEKERQIIVGRYYLHKTQSEIANTYGMTQVQVSRLENKIIGRLRQEIAVSG